MYNYCTQGTTMDQDLLEAIILTAEPELEFYAHNGALYVENQPVGDISEIPLTLINNLMEQHYARRTI